jgi:hypothetical protein
MTVTRETAPELLRSCRDCLAEMTMELFGAVISDLVEHGFTVSIGRYPEVTRPASYQGKLYAQVVNRDIKLNVSTDGERDENKMDVLARALDFAASVCEGS